MKAITTTKQAFEEGIITKIMRGLNGMVRIDARTRNRVADMDCFFSKWVSEKYADTLCLRHYSKNCSDMRVYQY